LTYLAFLCFFPPATTLSEASVAAAIAASLSFSAAAAYSAAFSFIIAATYYCKISLSVIASPNHNGSSGLTPLLHMYTQNSNHPISVLSLPNATFFNNSAGLALASSQLISFSLTSVSPMISQ